MKKVASIIMLTMIVSNFKIQSAENGLKAGAGAGAKSNPASLTEKRRQQQATKELLQACRIPGSSIESIQRFIELGADINQPNFDGRTALSYALENGNTPLVLFLLNADVQQSINAIDNKGLTALHFACISYNAQMVKLLLDYGATESINQISIHGNTPLLYASQQGDYDKVTLLLDYGATKSIDHANNNGNTPLLYATIKNNLDMVYLLLNSGHLTSINQVNNEDHTPLLWAAINNNVPMTQLLLGYTNPVLDLSILANMNALHRAIEDGHLDIVAAIIESNSFKEQDVILAEEILAALNKTARYVRPGEDRFNQHYLNLEGVDRTNMISLLEKYVFREKSLNQGLK